MQIDIETNPNCTESPQFVFNELGPAEPVRAILVGDEGREAECDVIGVEAGGQWIQATATKIADSSDGFAYLILGGAWGIRLRPEKYRAEAWDLQNKNQWGEPFKVYGKQQDLIYGTV